MRRWQVFTMVGLIILAIIWQTDAFALKTTAMILFAIDPSVVGLVLAMPAIAMPFPQDPVLTSVVVAYKNPRLIQDLAVPRSPVGKAEFKYKKYALADNFTIPDTLVGRTSRPGLVNFGYTEIPNCCEDYGLDGLVPQKDIDNAPNGYDPIAHQATSVMDLVLLAREKRCADLLFNNNSYAATNRVALAGNDQWSDPVNSDPIRAILNALDLMIMRANKMVIGQRVWTTLRQHPKVMKATNKNSGDSGAAAREAVAEQLELEEIIVGQSYQNTAKKGQAATVARLWGNFCSLIYQDPLATVTGDRMTFALTAQHGNRISGKNPDPNCGLKGGITVRSGEIVKEFISADDLGYLFSNVIA